MKQDSASPRKNSTQVTPLKITIIYLIVGGLWILFSDKILAILIQDSATLSQFQTLKGWFFIVVTAALLYYLIKNQLSTILRSESALRESEKKHRALLESASEGIVITNETGKMVMVNAKTEKLFGYHRDELIGQSVELLLPEKLQEGHQQHRLEYRQDMQQRPMGKGRHLTGQRKDSSEFPVEISLSPVRTDEGTLVMSFISDISERKRAQEVAKEQQQQLMQADKMATLGILVSGVAHEINNPNNYILLNGKILSRAWNDVAPILEKYYQEHGDFSLAGMAYSKAHKKIGQLIGGISEGAKRIQKIVQSLKDFARQEREDIQQQVDINSVVESAIVIINNLIKKSTHNFSVQYGQDIPNIRGNFQQLEQVVINLITNSCQALPDQDRAITVVTEYDADAHRVRLRVTDEGPGISEENLKRILDPFFTTKRDAGGTGLGLSISYNIAKDHGGKLDFNSEPGKGTTVTLSLPVDYQVKTERSKEEVEQYE